MTITESVINVYRSARVRGLSWAIPQSNYFLDAKIFATVANKIESGDVAVVPWGHHSTCKYQRETNTLAVPSGWGDIVGGPGAWGLVIHEGVHIIQDIKRRTIGAADDEITAYITQALHMRRVTRSDSPPTTTTADYQLGYVLACAYAAACAIEEQRMSYFTPAVIQQLEDALLALPEYSDPTGRTPSNPTREYDGI